MFENEAPDQDVSSGESSPSPESQSSQSAEPKQEQQTKELPFHEHPRFKELINQRNEFSQRLQEYEKRFKDMDSKLEQSAPKAQTPEGRLLERLKGIDPEFGSWAEQQHNARAQLEKDLAEQKQWRQAQEQQSQQGRIQSSLEKLHSEHKVPEAMRDVYEAQLERAAKANPNLSLSDLPKVYKEIHDRHSQYIESIKRDTLASYSQGKTKDSSIPAPAKGTSPKPGTPKFEYSKDPQEARAQVVKNALKGLKN